MSIKQLIISAIILLSSDAMLGCMLGRDDDDEEMS
jgi:hypothetical protein